MTDITEDKGRLAHFPISFFATVMGLSGLTIAWEKAQQIWGIDLGINTAMITVTAVVFCVLFILYMLKLAKHGDMVKAELKHPIKLSFFPAISISMILLSTAFLSINTAISLPLWIVGSSLHLIFTLYVINSWMHHEHYQIQHINPAWFIPAVGNILVPVAGVTLGFTEISWFFFSIGFMFWIILMTIVFNRMMFHDSLLPHLVPTLFILIAPPAVGLIAYVRLTGELGAFGNILYGAALFLTLLLFTQVQRFIRLPFFLSWWAYSFPLAAITIASFVMYEKTASMLYFWVANGLLAILTLVLVILIFKTVLAIKKGGICQPGH
jgi:tellurite resistance protein